jgi:hypothetical protein
MSGILGPSTVWNEKQIRLIEQRYDAVYLLDTCLPARGGGWCNWPAAIFYQETPPDPNFSNYFAFFIDRNTNRSSITDGYKAIAAPIDCLLFNDGSVLHSRFRHDYRELEDGASVDGGRDYFRFSLSKDCRRAIMHIDNGAIEVFDA